jgi:hypothetical protein
MNSFQEKELITSGESGGLIRVLVGCGWGVAERRRTFHYRSITIYDLHNTSPNDNRLATTLISKRSKTYFSKSWEGVMGRATR